MYCRGSEVESRLAHDQCALKWCDMKNDRGEHHCHRHYTMWMSIAEIETWCSDLMCFNVIHLIVSLCQHKSSSRVITAKHFFLFIFDELQDMGLHILSCCVNIYYDNSDINQVQYLVPHLQIYCASIYRLFLPPNITLISNFTLQYSKSVPPFTVPILPFIASTYNSVPVYRASRGSGKVHD